MREFTPLGVEWVAKALRLNSELEVDETNTKVRRTTEIQEPKGQFDRSIYAVSVISTGVVIFMTLCPERIWR
jgi:lupus La protein